MLTRLKLLLIIVDHEQQGTLTTHITHMSQLVPHSLGRAVTMMFTVTLPTILTSSMTSKSLFHITAYK